MELSTPFLHLKFDPKTMQFVSDANKINDSENNLLSYSYQNYNSNEFSKSESKFENEIINPAYHTLKIKNMKSNIFTFLFSTLLICLVTVNASAQTGAKTTSFGGKGSLTEDSLNTFISFSPVHLDGKTYVRWLVKNDKKDGIFVVERSEDGTDFEALGFRDRVGTELLVNLFYSFVDEEPFSGTSLYRVMQVGADNTYKYSAVVKVKNEKNPNRGSSSASETTISK